MRRREVGLSIAAGLVLLLLAVVDPAGIGPLIDRYILSPAFNFWYLGVGAIVLALVLQSRRMWPGVVGIVGLVGIAWVTFVAGAVAWLFVMLATSGPFGP